MDALSPTGAYLPLGPALGRRQASSAAVVEGATSRGDALDRFPRADARRPVSEGRESASRAPIGRFIAKVHIGPETGCWEWIASRSRKGYGHFWDGERDAGAHRFSYELLIGPIPDGLTLDHLCRNPGCANPWHAEPVTGRVNTLRGTSFSAVNAAKTQCINGHPFSGANLRTTTKGYRRCRACDYETSRRQYPRRREQQRLYARANRERKRETEQLYRQRKREAAIASDGEKKPAS